MATTSYSQSQSTSEPVVIDFPQSALLQSIAQYASQLADATYNWGQQQYAKTSNITDQNINSYLTTSAQALANAQNDQQRYQALFQPQENQLIKDANTYNSLARQQYEMGRAEATAGQAFDAARENHIRNLQSYGIDPSSGRYDELDRADQLARSAAEAAAGQQAYENTAQTGRNLRQQAIQVGQAYPGMITNALNTALQGYSGAENAALANANTGVALQNSANPYLQTGMSLKYPPVGQRTQSTSTGGNSGGGGSSGGGSRSPSGGGGGGGLGDGGGGGYGGSGYGSPAPTADVSGAGYYDGSSGDGSFWDYNGGDFGGGIGYGGNSYDLGYDNPFYDPYSATGSLGDNTGSDSSSTYGDPWSNQWYDPYSAYAGGGGDYSYDNSSYLSGFSDYGGGDYGGGDYGYFAQGGAVLDRKAGGHVPTAASPSGGAQVDDVRANLNANEFVIPRDVALWKGQEFFQKLIMDARKNNANAAAKPRMGGPNGPRR